VFVDRVWSTMSHNVSGDVNSNLLYKLMLLSQYITGICRLSVELSTILTAVFRIFLYLLQIPVYCVV
jgi:hypothetical protein